LRRHAESVRRIQFKKIIRIGMGGVSIRQAQRCFDNAAVVIEWVAWGDTACNL